MHIVIEIPDRIYRTIQKRHLNIIDKGIVEDTIRNGVLLPKGHGRLIDAKELDDVFWDNHSKLHQYCDIASAINLAPTILEADEEE